MPAKGPFGPYRQMQRLDRYTEVADKLLAEDKAYYCYCTHGGARAPTRPPRRPPTSRRTTSVGAHT